MEAMINKRKSRLTKILFAIGIVFISWNLITMISKGLDGFLYYYIMKLGGFYSFIASFFIGLIFLLISFVIWENKKISKFSIFAFSLSILIFLWIIFNLGYPIFASLCEESSADIGSSLFCQPNGNPRVLWPYWLFALFSPLSLILNIIGLIKSHLKGKGFTIAGIILSAISVVYYLLFNFFFRF